MGDGTSISWTDATWNPVRGCSRVSEGCRNCYAEAVAARFSDEGQAYHGLADRSRAGSKWTGEVRLIAEHLADPLRWKKPRRIFVNSMSDLFHEKLTNEQIAAVFGVMAAARKHTFQVLTKRATRMREWFAWAESKAGCAIGRLAFILGEAAKALPDVPPATRDEKHGPSATWPLPNVWLGVSVENQDAANARIPPLLATPAAVHFLSMEPLLGAVDLHKIQIPDEREGLAFSALQRQHDDRFGSSDTVLSWVIVGCESGPGARPCDVAWLRSLRDQCAAASVPFFLKQAAERVEQGIRLYPSSLAARAPDREVVVAGDGSRVKSRGVIELPYLDGVQHAAFPEAS